MAMENSLPSGFPIVYPDIESCDAPIYPLDSLFLLLYKTVAGVELRAAELEVAPMCRFGITSV